MVVERVAVGMEAALAVAAATVDSEAGVAAMAEFLAVVMQVGLEVAWVARASVAGNEEELVAVAVQVG